MQASRFLRIPVGRCYGATQASCPKIKSTSSSCRFGTYSRMLDMGGSPSASSDSTSFRLNKANRNSKLKAVAFDFNILTNSFNKSEATDATKADEATTSATETIKIATSATVQPDISMVQQFASMLNVKMGGDDDTAAAAVAATKNATKAALKRGTSDVHQDIRAKYAKKLKGGLAGIELAKSQVEDSLQRGDAAGHMAARKAAASADSAPTWMAMTGTGKLLSYLSNRSIHIALLPGNPAEADSRMHQLGKQMKGIVIDYVFDPVPEQTAEPIITKFVSELPDYVETKCVMVISEREDYLSAARDAGMITCRLRKLNQRRGITAHYDVTDVSQIQDVVNDIAGISFNAVLNR